MRWLLALSFVVACSCAPQNYRITLKDGTIVYCVEARGDLTDGVACRDGGDHWTLYNGDQIRTLETGMTPA